MFWDASFDQNNVINGKHFSEHIRDMYGNKGPTPTGKPKTLSPNPNTKEPVKTTKGPVVTTKEPVKTQPPTRPSKFVLNSSLEPFSNFARKNRVGS